MESETSRPQIKSLGDRIELLVRQIANEPLSFEVIDNKEKRKRGRPVGSEIWFRYRIGKNADQQRFHDFVRRVCTWILTKLVLMGKIVANALELRDIEPEPFDNSRGRVFFQPWLV